MKRYRFYRADGTYEVGVGSTRGEAEQYAILKGKITADEIIKSSLAGR